MAFKTSYNAALGIPAIALSSVDTFAKLAIGATVKGFDDLLGEGTFMYLPGVASLVAADAVVYDLLPGSATVTRATTALANTGQPLAIAVTAIGAGQYGWYQVAGVAIVNTIAGTAIGKSFLSATAGQLSSVTTAGSQVEGARTSSAVGTPAAGQSYITMVFPSVQTQIT